MDIRFKGNKLNLSRAMKPKNRQNSTNYLKGATKIFVGGLPTSISAEELRSYFEQYGPIDDLCLPMENKAKKINRGHAFINYVYPLSARLVVEQYQNHAIRAKWVN